MVDVNTGAILALASYPTFEPAIFNPDTPFPFVGNYIAELATDETRPLVNRAVSEQFSPGSVFKVVTTAAVVVISQGSRASSCRHCCFEIATHQLLEWGLAHKT